MISSKVPLNFQILVFIPHLTECFKVLAMFSSPGHQLLALLKALQVHKGYFLLIELLIGLVALLN